MPGMIELDADGELIGGFMVDFYKELGYVGGFDVQLVPFTDPEVFVDPTAVTVRALNNGSIDIGYSYSRAEIPPGFVATFPMQTIPNVAMTKKVQVPVDFWQVFAPFSDGLWWMVGASIVYGAVIMCLLHIIDSSGQSKIQSAKNFLTFIYQ